MIRQRKEILKFFLSKHGKHFFLKYTIKHLKDVLTIFEVKSLQRIYGGEIGR